MTKFEYLLPYFEYIPEELRSRACIAGGAVLDLRRASDVDIFILGCPETDELQIATAYILARGYTFSDEASSDKKAFVFTDKKGKTINVICAEQPSIFALLDDFDISTSMWAVDSTGIGHRVPKSTSPGLPIIVYYVSKTTLGRIQKYSARFGTGYKGRQTE